MVSHVCQMSKLFAILITPTHSGRLRSETGGRLLGQVQTLGSLRTKICLFFLIELR